MRDEYNINELNPQKNPYLHQLKLPVTIDLDITTIDYFKSQAANTGIPFQDMIDLYLKECVSSQRQINLSL